MDPSLRWGDDLHQRQYRPVMPAKAGIHAESGAALGSDTINPRVRHRVSMDPSLRWGDDLHQRHHLPVMPAKAGIHAESGPRESLESPTPTASS